MGYCPWSHEPFAVGDYVKVECCLQVAESERKKYDGRRGVVTKIITYRRGEYGIPLVEVLLDGESKSEVFEDVDLNRSVNVP